MNPTFKLPTFSLKDSHGQEHKLSDHLGKWIVVYFYPRDNTPGCTREACDFRDQNTALKERDCVVFGISKDSVNSHLKFSNQYDLNFSLLSDPELLAHRHFGALADEKVVRSTYLINPKGLLVKSWSPVKVDGHVDQVLDELDELA